MKKIIFGLMIFGLFFAVSPVYSADTEEDTKVEILTLNPNFENAKAEIIEELNLSAKQQKKAEKIYTKAKEKIVVLNNKINDKQKEARAIKLSRIDTRVQLEKLIKINTEVDILYQTRDKIHNDAMRKFDALLNKNQKKIWNELKIQGARFFPEIEKMI